MRRLWPVIFFGLWLISACDKTSHDNNLNKEIKISNLNNSGCKNHQKSTGSYESIHFKMLDDSQLLVEHNNVFFNCLPGKITVNYAMIAEDHLNLYEDEEKDEANCICPYDLSFKIDGMNAGEKTESIYMMNIERLTYTLNLSNSTDTLILVTDQ